MICENLRIKKSGEQVRVRERLKTVRGDGDMSWVDEKGREIFKIFLFNCAYFYKVGKIGDGA